MLTPTFIQCFHYAEKPSNSDELIKTIEEGALSEDQNFSWTSGCSVSIGSIKAILPKICRYRLARQFILSCLKLTRPHQF